MKPIIKFTNNFTLKHKHNMLGWPYELGASDMIQQVDYIIGKI